MRWRSRRAPSGKTRGARCAGGIGSSLGAAPSAEGHARARNLVRAKDERLRRRAARGYRPEDGRYVGDGVARVCEETAREIRAGRADISDIPTLIGSGLGGRMRSRP